MAPTPPNTAFADAIWRDRTWGEREKLLKAFYGNPKPPGAAAGSTVPMTGQARKKNPGGCVLVCPPAAAGGPKGARADGWIYVSHGPTQPLDPRAHEAAKAKGDDRSGYGWEFAIEVAKPADWVAATLANLAFWARDPSVTPFTVGSRLPFFLEDKGAGKVEAGVGPLPEKAKRAGAAAALLLWHDLRIEEDFSCETGWFGVMLATTATEDELAAAQQTSTAHVLALFRRAGIGQRSDPFRPSLLADPRWGAEWEKIRGLDQKAAREIVYDG